MIKMIYDHNILDETEYSIVIPVNCVGVMGAGLAKSFKKLYPYSVEGYREACKDKSIMIKGFVTTKIPHRPPVIFLATKYHFSEISSKDLIDHALKCLKEEIHLLDIHKIALPKIGTGCGKLDWRKDVFPIIRKHFEDSDIEVLCYV